MLRFIWPFVHAVTCMWQSNWFSFSSSDHALAGIHVLSINSDGQFLDRSSKAHEYRFTGIYILGQILRSNLCTIITRALLGSWFYRLCKLMCRNTQMAILTNPPYDVSEMIPVSNGEIKRTGVKKYVEGHLLAQIPRFQ